MPKLEVANFMPIAKTKVEAAPTDSVHRTVHTLALWTLRISMTCRDNAPCNRPRHLLPLPFLCFLLLIATPALPAEQLIQGGPQRVQLVELYTSEGCSSCPPADRWMSELLGQETLWSAFVPVAFHVDYWNDLGWPDRFSSPWYSRRQRDYARRGGLRTVYTPGFVLNGREWRGFFRGQELPRPAREQAGLLSLHVDADRQLRIRYEAAAPLPDSLRLNLVLLGFALSSEVDAGENRGRTLKHNFAVLAWQEEDLHGQAGLYTGAAQLPHSPHAAGRTALAAWLSHPGHPAPIQAAGGMLQQGSSPAPSL